MKMKETNNFDLNMIKIMTHLYQNDAVTDDIIDIMRDIGLDYHSLITKNDILEKKINFDEKTNLLKYRDDYLSMILKSASRIVEKVSEGFYHISYIRFDLDDFSIVNNLYGHDMGDRVLIDMAKLLKRNSRPTDYVIRFGGEEFDVILPATDKNGALQYLNKIYDRINKFRFRLNNDSIQVTASAGVSFYSIPFDRLKIIDTSKITTEYRKLQKLADDALYDAKVSGKCQFKIYNRELNYKVIREKYTGHKLISTIDQQNACNPGKYLNSVN